ARHIDSDLRINPQLVRDVLVRFIKAEVTRTGLLRTVIGLSGGVDSALTAYLAVEALGKESVHGVLLPYRTSSADSRSDALSVVADLGISHETVDITPMADPYLGDDNSLGDIRRGNVLARLRMIILYDVSARGKALVLGTSNK
ncbi:MAG: NAD(+) synthase, partial [Ignavibacteriales bacterium CG07_land_8_20_14_0_80_59_12]